MHDEVAAGKTATREKTKQWGLSIVRGGRGVAGRAIGAARRDLQLRRAPGHSDRQSSAWHRTAPAMAQQATEADAKAAATTVSQAFAQAYNSEKPAGIAELFADDGIYVTPAATVLRNHTDIERAITARQKAGWTKDPSPSSRRTQPAITCGRWSATISTVAARKTASRSVAMLCKCLSVMVRTGILLC